MEIEVKDDNYANLYTSGFLGDGEVANFVMPAGGWIVTKVVSGTNVPHSSVSANLYRP